MAETRSAARMGAWSRNGAEVVNLGLASPDGTIPTWTFWYWRRKLSATPAPEPPARVPFVPVQVAVDDGPVIELMFTSGERLQVRAGASADLVRATVSALRSVC